MRTETAVSLASGSSTSVPTALLDAAPTYTTISIGSCNPILSSSMGRYRFAEYWAQEFRMFTRPLTDEDLKDHLLNPFSYGSRDPVSDGSKLALHYRFDEGTEAASSAPQTLHYPLGVVQTFATGSGIPSGQRYKRFLLGYQYIVPPDSGWTDDKIRVHDTTDLAWDDTPIDQRTLSVEFNMIDALNEDISQVLSAVDELNTIIGLPANRFRDEYEGLRQLRDEYFKRLQGNLNFRAFADMLDLFDRGFIETIRKLVPMRARFVGDEFVVESHMLERPKVAYVRSFKQAADHTIEGVISAKPSVPQQSVTAQRTMFDGVETEDMSSIIKKDYFAFQLPSSIKG
jgi:hypothetical protein